jgi:diphthamide synthase (EF-2-diphthine--ammonia ligase)
MQYRQVQYSPHIKNLEFKTCTNIDKFSCKRLGLTSLAYLWQLDQV